MEYMQTNLEEIVKIQPRGLFTIPKKLRTTLGLSDNSLVRVKKEKGRLVVEPVGTFPYSVRSYTEEDIKQFIELDKEESEALKKKRML
jgi:AbrB family looped-hinge helix DNA binding protein